MKAYTRRILHTTGKKPNLIQQVGFTLIELSIVLVIIGLIVGGVLVGQDLIKAAEIRATIGQYEKYNSAMNTFRTKYNAMPGDMPFATANAFGIGPSGTTLTAGGDGNGLIESTAATNLNIPALETILIWQQLSAGSLVDGSFGAAITTAGVLGATPTPALYLPPAKLGRGNYWIAGSSAGYNYYGLAVVSAISATTYTAAAGGGLTPVEAFNIDSKLDDGNPNTGIIQAKGGQAMAATPDAMFAALSATAAPKWTSATVPVAGDCVTTGASATDTADTYARGAASGGTTACTLRLRFN